MNGENTNVLEKVNRPKILKFGVERILSNEFSSKRTGEPKIIINHTYVCAYIYILYF